MEINQENLEKICVYAKFVKSGDDWSVRDDVIHCTNQTKVKDSKYYHHYCVASCIGNIGHIKNDAYIDLDKINLCEYCSLK